MARTALASCLLLAACGSGGSLPRCASDQDCGPGSVCERPVAGERGVCIAPWSVSLEAPRPGTWIGLAGAPARASLRAVASGRVEPQAIDLLADGSPAAVLSRTGPGTYEGLFAPVAGAPAQTALSAAVARATPDEVRSAPVEVWVDVDAPVLALAGADCAAAPCPRDGVLKVRATAADANLASVEAVLDLDPARTFPLALAGAEWTADVDLGGLPFPALAADVGVRVVARDAAGNEAAAAAAVPATRVRWTYDAGAPVTSPAVMADGTLLVGVSAAIDQLRAVRPDGVELWRATVGTGFITAAPSLGPTAIWVASQDGRVYAVRPDGTAILNGSGCNTGGALEGTPAIGSGSPEVAFVGSGVGRLYAADSTGAICAKSLATDAFAAPAAIDATGSILAATATATATLRKYIFDGAFGEVWSVQVGVNVGAPIAIDASGNAWTGSQDARLNATTPAGATATVKTLGGSIVDSPVILAGGDVVVGDQARVLHRIRPDGTLAWATEPALDGPVLAPLALAGGPAALLVPTSAGTLHAVAADGSVLWSGTLSPGQALRAGNLRAPPGGAFSTAYFGSADGRLRAVAVEGRLDEAAPWPKAHRDSRNTSNALGPLP